MKVIVLHILQATWLSGKIALFSKIQTKIVRLFLMSFSNSKRLISPKGVCLCVCMLSKLAD